MHWVSQDLSDFDYIILDIGMPRMDGYEVVQELRARGYDKPVIALTGYGLEDDKQKAFAAGFTSHLTKPIGIADLQAVFKETSPLLSAKKQTDMQFSAR